MIAARGRDAKYLFAVAALWTLVGTNVVRAEVPPVDGGGTTVLFGDLHAHTTLSTDAALQGTTASVGWGFAQPALACEFARHCSGLDFWSINDHAIGLFEAQWTETKEAIRACNAAYGGDTANPEMVSFVGFEWSQIGTNAGNHYGHRNVVFPDTGDAEVPSRPIAASIFGHTGSPPPYPPPPPPPPTQFPVATINGEFPVYSASLDAALFSYVANVVSDAYQSPLCNLNVPPQALPTTCQEAVITPKALHDRLEAWGFDYIAIPHALGWGLSNPSVVNLKNFLGNNQFRPDRELFWEVYSGHGNVEEYRPWREAEGDISNGFTCPAPTADYEPCCWRARRIALDHAPACQADPGSPGCLTAQDLAQQTYLNNEPRGVEYVQALYYPVSTVQPEEWSDCGACRDCFNPAYNLQPTGSAQAGFATAKIGPTGGAARFRMGLVGGTDGHRGRPGSGFKDLKRHSDLSGYLIPGVEEFVLSKPPGIHSRILRASNFLFAGGIVAVHSADRSRGEIWNALKRKEAYGTSGPRILLWFDAVPAGSMTPVEMGGSVATDASPTFRAKAIGDFVQDPGCPASLVAAKGQTWVDEMCLNECYNPAATRHPIDRFEVVRIQPQTSESESLDGLIDDPWMTIPCAPDPEGCEISFTDPDYAASGRSAVYYVRALQAETQVLNVDGYRCQNYNGGECTEIDRCKIGFNGIGDPCTAPGNHRAWSSPIFVDPTGTCLDGDQDGFSLEGGACGPVDCDDVRAEVNPDGTEICGNGLDDDCDGGTDGADDECPSCVDADGDGYGVGDTSPCPHPEPDCDDTNPTVHPYAEEIPDNGIDENCNGEFECGSVTEVGASPWAALVYLAPVAAIVLGRRRLRRR